MTARVDLEQTHQLLRATAATPRAWRPPTRPPQKSIDQGQLDDLRDSLGPVKLLQFLELAQAEVALRPGVIRKIAEQGDLGQLRSEAHSFRGAVASLGLVGVALAARAVELAAPGAELVLALDRLDREAVGARIALAPLIRGLPLEVAVNG